MKKRSELNIDEFDILFFGLLETEFGKSFDNTDKLVWFVRNYPNQAHLILRNEKKGRKKMNENDSLCK